MGGVCVGSSVLQGSDINEEVKLDRRGGTGPISACENSAFRTHGIALDGLLEFPLHKCTKQDSLRSTEDNEPKCDEVLGDSEHDLNDECIVEFATSPTGDSSPSGMKTLSDSGSEISARHAAYLERKQKKQAKKKGKGISAENFLSNLPEVNADIEYRYNFVVMGASCERLVVSVCTSSAATALSDLQTFDRAASTQSSLSTNTKTLNRCFAMVVPGGDGEEAGAKKLAKLAFQSYSNMTDLPQCQNRADALSTAVVFIMNVNPSEDQPERSLKHQLVEYEELVFELRRTPKKCRAARAVVLCHDGELLQSDAEGFPSWTTAIEEFEQVDGPIWKFGPVSWDDGDALHEVFASIASARLLRTQRTDAGDSDGSHASSAPPIWEAEREEDDDDEDDAPAPPVTAPQIDVPYLTQMQRGAA
mmetsp:Transcript_2087/g.5087  ORF Transcript_2087/g.5087 Transcript_2087/m.5087 type:complete len:419 (-) Transcript_2087:98-1354(-)|eukprot:CAMPEP_0117534944 /NCGR_PEP_ID=MMETSP0784-20121206/40676_1 /TAXON_ID=39447 /ORGANISM="" /LENGTH=418 /DNA_ID=CAMNT_0005331447 /DNA_START=80 /DNA_END=1336 /DNA_ORIENTATION=+